MEELCWKLPSIPLRLRLYSLLGSRVTLPPGSPLTSLVIFFAVSFTNSSSLLNVGRSQSFSPFSLHNRCSQLWLHIIIFHGIKRNAQAPTLTLWGRGPGIYSCETQSHVIVIHSEGWEPLLSLLDLSILFTTGAPAVTYIWMTAKFTSPGTSFLLSFRSVFPTALRHLPLLVVLETFQNQ